MARKLILTAVPALVLAAALAAAPGIAHADPDRGDARNAAALAGASIGLTQAIATAEQHTGGKAFDAGLERRDGGPLFKVDTTGAQGVRSVMVDARTGAIVTSVTGDDDDVD